MSRDLRGSNHDDPGPSLLSAIGTFGPLVGCSSGRILILAYFASKSPSARRLTWWTERRSGSTHERNARAVGRLPCSTPGSGNLALCGLAAALLAHVFILAAAFQPCNSCFFADQMLPLKVRPCTSGSGGRCGTVLRHRRGILRIRFSAFDAVWALASPVIALSVRSVPIFTNDAAIYCLISLAFTLIGYSAFRLHDGVSRFFSVHDAWNVVRAVASAELMTCLVLFTLTRLGNIPRSTPLIHALILCAGLITIRAIARLREVDSGVDAPVPHHGAEHVIMIGATKLSFLFMKFLAAYCPGQRRVIALLDGGPTMLN